MRSLFTKPVTSNLRNCTFGIYYTCHIKRAQLHDRYVLGLSHQHAQHRSQISKTFILRTVVLVEFGSLTIVFGTCFDVLIARLTQGVSRRFSTRHESKDGQPDKLLG